MVKNNEIVRSTSALNDYGLSPNETKCIKRVHWIIQCFDYQDSQLPLTSAIVDHHLYGKGDSQPMAVTWDHKNAHENMWYCYGFYYKSITCVVCVLKFQNKKHIVVKWDMDHYQNALWNRIVFKFHTIMLVETFSCNGYYYHAEGKYHT